MYNYYPTREDFFPKLGRFHREPVPYRHEVKGTKRIVNPIPCGCEQKKGVLAKDHINSTMRLWVEEHGGKVTNKNGDKLPDFVIGDMMLQMTGVN